MINSSARKLFFVVLAAGALFALGVFVVQHSWAGTDQYHVRADGSDTGCTGRDNRAYPGSGSGIACAFRTIQRAADAITPGDDIMIHEGTYAAFTLRGANSGGAFQGTASNPTVIEGDPLVPRERIIIEGGASRAAIYSAGGGSSGSRSRFITFRHLHLAGGTDAALYMAGENSDVVVKDILMDGMSKLGGSSSGTINGGRHSGGVRDAAIIVVIGGWSTYPGNFLFEDLKIVGRQTYCASPQGGGSVCGEDASAINFTGTFGTVRRVEAENFLGNFLLRAPTDGVVEYNTIKNFGCDSDDGCIQLYNVARSTIRYNVFINSTSLNETLAVIRMRRTNGSTGEPSATIYNNTFIGNTTGGFSARHTKKGVDISPPGTASSYGATAIKNNIFINNFGDSDGASGALTLGWCPSSLDINNNLYFNNTKNFANVANCAGSLETRAVYADPRLDANYVPPLGSPACGAGDPAYGRDIGAKSCGGGGVVPSVPPVANAGPDMPLATNGAARITGTATDSDGVIMSVQWSIPGCTFLLTGQTGIGSNSAQSIIDVTCPLGNTSSSYTATITAGDNSGLTASDSAILTFSPATPTVPSGPTTPPPPATNAGTPEGFGSATTGGESACGEPCQIVYVTNLNDSGAGSLREALSGSNRRIHFKVGGTINLASKLSLRAQNNVTVDGATAPSPGITLKGQEFEIRHSNNIIVRHIRSRDSAKINTPGFTVWCPAPVPAGKSCENVWLDHLSVSGVTDDSILVYEGPKNVTVSWSFVRDGKVTSVDPSPEGMNISGANGNYADRVSVHHNILSNNYERNPSVGGDPTSAVTGKPLFDFRNNIVYNWGSGGYGARIRWNATGNIVKNIFSSSRSAASALVLDSPGPVYVSGNQPPTGGTLPLGNRTTLISAPAITEHSISELPQALYDSVGALPRDSVDAVAIAAIKSGVGQSSPAPVADTVPPERSSGQPSGTLAAGTTQATLSIRTSEAATCRYATTQGVSYYSMPGVFYGAGKTLHSRTISVSNGASYAFYARCADAALNVNTSDFLISFSVASPTTIPTPPPAPTVPSGPAGGPTPSAFRIGDRVKVTEAVNVRSLGMFDSALLGTQPAGALGAVVGGPNTAGGYVWWKINYGNSPDGWSVQNYLVKVTEASVPSGGDAAAPGVSQGADAPTTTPTSKITLGSKVTTVAVVTLRKAPSLAADIYYEKKVLGETGTVIDGPVVSGGETWWNVDFVYAPDGWTTENNLALVSAVSSGLYSVSGAAAAILQMDPRKSPTCEDVRAAIGKVLTRDADIVKGSISAEEVLAARSHQMWDKSREQEMGRMNSSEAGIRQFIATWKRQAGTDAERAAVSAFESGAEQLLAEWKNSTGAVLTEFYNGIEKALLAKKDGALQALWWRTAGLEAGLVNVTAFCELTNSPQEARTMFLKIHAQVLGNYQEQAKALHAEYSSAYKVLSAAKREGEQRAQKVFQDAYREAVDAFKAAYKNPNIVAPPLTPVPPVSGGSSRGAPGAVDAP